MVVASLAFQKASAVKILVLLVGFLTHLVFVIAQVLP
jgi:hypothetical protein